MRSAKNFSGMLVIYSKVLNQFYKSRWAVMLITIPNSLIDYTRSYKSNLMQCGPSQFVLAENKNKDVGKPLYAKSSLKPKCVEKSLMQNFADN